MPNSGFAMMPIMFTVVPLLLGVAGLWILITAVRSLLRNSGLARSGLRVDGRVISSNVKITGGGPNSSSSSRMVETIEFTTSNGQRIRGVPASSDVGMLDRTGEEVTVLHHRDRPDLFIAPRNGRAMSPLGPIGRILFSLVFLGIVGFSIWFALGMSSQMGGMLGG